MNAELRGGAGPSPERSGGAWSL